MTKAEKDVIQLRFLVDWLRSYWMTSRWTGDQLRYGITLPKHCWAVRSLNAQIHALERVVKRLKRKAGKEKA